jgi:nanoRNase/pAp phosphatase (c-di-AMP/oligoRNAs hydrolase)
MSLVKNYRLVTRSDMDGLVSAILLRELDMVDEIKFVHPKDVQDGLVELTERDITTNLPYVETVHMCFDHHYSETLRLDAHSPNYVIDSRAPSAARVVYDFFGGRARFPDIPEEMMDAVDKSDSAQFNEEEILHPAGWDLLSFIMDARTGLGRFKNFRVSNYTLMMDLVSYCRNHPIEQILALPDVQERAELYLQLEPPFKEQLRRCATLHKNLVVLDLRAEETIYPGNRFMVYSLFPQCNLSIHVLWGVKKQNTVFAVGKSILDRSAPVKIGALMLEYGGGGHAEAGTCQVANDSAERVKQELIERLLAAA